MFTECAVFSSTTPICSAACMNRLLNTSSITGSARPRTASLRAARRERVSTRHPTRVDARPPAALEHRRRVRLGHDRGARERSARRERGAVVERRRRATRPRKRRSRVATGRGAPGAVPRCGGSRPRGRRRSRVLRGAARWPRPRSTRRRAARRAPRGSRSAARAPPRTRRAARAAVGAAGEARGERRVGAFDFERDAPLDLDARRVRRLAPRARRAPPPRARRTRQRALRATRRRARASTLRRRSTRTSATPMPYADSTPASGWITIEPMPSASATWHACCPAAPPKQQSANRVTSWPRCTEICLIAFAMRSTAIRKIPAASCSGVRALARRRRATARASAANAAAVAPASSGASRAGPEHAREEVGLDPAEQHVRVGDRERPAVAVARGARQRARGLGPDLQPAVRERDDRAAAGGDGVDPQHRRAHAHAPRSRRRPCARARPRTATRRSTCRPCRSRRRRRTRPRAPRAACRSRRPRVRTAGCPCLRSARRR